VARALANTPAYERSRHRRKRVEMLFAHLKRILRLGGPTIARILRRPRRVHARRHCPEPQKARQAQANDRSRIGQTGIRRCRLRRQGRVPITNDQFTRRATAKSPTKSTISARSGQLARLFSENNHPVYPTGVSCWHLRSRFSTDAKGRASPSRSRSPNGYSAHLCLDGCAISNFHRSPRVTPETRLK
jgi:hypothetical protein